MREGVLDLLYNGSDFIISESTGVAETESMINMIVLGIFGGNVEASEPITRTDDEVIKSYWGNSNGYNENSNTERLLRNVILSSSTPRIVEKSVLSDLDFLKENMDIECDVIIPFRDRLQINIYLRRKGGGRTSKASILWAIMATGGGGTTSNDLLGFDFTLDFKMT